MIVLSSPINIVVGHEEGFCLASCLFLSYVGGYAGNAHQSFAGIAWSLELPPLEDGPYRAVTHGSFLQAFHKHVVGHCDRMLAR